MSQTSPRYFYIAHIHISHPLLLQKIVDYINPFRVHDPDCHIVRTNPQNGFLTLNVSSNKRISETAIETFERNLPFVEGLKIIFTHKTTDSDKNGQNFPPTFVYSAYYALNFNWLSQKLGRVRSFENALRKTLQNIQGGSYYLYVNPSYMALILESTKPFKSGELNELFKKLEANSPVLLTSFSTFPAT